MIKRLFILGWLFIAFTASVEASSPTKVSQTTYSSYVEPRIGTAHCRWFHFAPGAYPFGMAKPGPSTNGHLGNASGWEATGYDYRDTSIEGFPCFHEFQVGGVSLMPTTGTLKTVPGDVKSTTHDGYRSTFQHSRETVTAGYYAVDLEDYSIKAEVTATERVAFQRFTYPKNDASHLLFDIGSRQGESGAVKDASVELLANGDLEGWVETEPEYVKKYQPGASVKMFFYAQVDKRPTAYGTFSGTTTQSGKTKITGPGAGLYLTFATKAGEQVTAKIGLSYTSTANALANLKAEAERLTFDQARQRSHEKWEELFGRLHVETAIKADKVKFYTSLYHALLGRGLASDVNGAYPKHDGSVGQLPVKHGRVVHHLYNTDAAWGAQWNLTQVWALAYPEYYSDYVSSHLQVYKDSGWLGDGLACSRYVSGVGTNLLSVIIAGAYQCGIRDFDLETGYEACLKNELDGHNRPFGAGKIDTDRFIRYGYVPHQDQGEGPAEGYMFSASHTLEYSFSAWAVAQWAKQRQQNNDYKELLRLSKGWERLYDPTTHFIRPKMADGRFIDKFDPMEVWRGFQEGNAWQYTFYVPHDIHSMIDKVGRETFSARLDSIFTISEKLIFSGGTEVGAFAGLKTLYNHGNQPCLHTSWLFNEAERPSLSQKWVRAILNSFYGTDGIHGYGYGQDEDQGQLGAWYVISSLGLFDIKGLSDETPSFALGSPLFDKIVIRLNPDYYRGKSFTINSSPTTPEKIYVDNYRLNGRQLTTPRIGFKEITTGGTLNIKRSSQPKDNYSR